MNKVTQIDIYSNLYHCRRGDAKPEYVSMPASVSSCHYIHNENKENQDSSVAALSDCSFGSLRGFVSAEGDTFEIAPLSPEQQKIATVLKSCYDAFTRC